MPIQDDITLAVIGINIILTLVLIVIYLKNYGAIKSKITAGLVIFMSAFLVENLVDFYYYNTILSQNIHGLTGFGLGVNVFEMIGLLVLIWVTWK